MKLRTKVLLIDLTPLWLLFPLGLLMILNELFVVLFLFSFIGIGAIRARIRCNKCGKMAFEAPLIKLYVPFRCPHCFHNYTELAEASRTP